MILKPAETFKTQIPFCSFRIWLICRYIPFAPDQCWPTFYGFVTYKCCRQVVHGPAIQRTWDPNIEGGWRGEERESSCSFLENSVEIFLNSYFYNHKNYKINIGFFQPP